VIILYCLVFITLLVLAFVPAIRELNEKEDAKELYINMDYSKDPHYFGDSFRRILTTAVEKAGVDQTISEMKLSRNEDVLITGTYSYIVVNSEQHVLLCRGSLDIEGPNTRNKEAYVMGNANMFDGSAITAMAVDGNLKMGKDVHVVRWLDSRGDVTVGDNCDLGVSVAGKGRVSLGKDCKFLRIYGKPVATREFVSQMNFIRPVKKQERYRHILGNYKITRGVILDQDLKIEGDFMILTRERVEIHGSVFVEGSVRIEGNVLITGNIFSQQTIHLRGIEVGSPDGIKSVIGKKEIVLFPDVVVHGYVMTEGEGITR